MTRLGRWWSRRVDGTVVWLDRVADEGLLPSARRRVLGVNPDRQLVPGEHVIDEVRHHWLAFVVPSLALLAALALLVRSFAVVPVNVLWVPLLVCLVVAAWASDRWLRAWKDRLVITDSRVVRISGVYSRKVAWMPLGRVLDITVDRPFWLRPFGCGHLVLENAAQEQGLRDVKLIPHPGDRALLIHALRTGVGPEVEPPRRPRAPDHSAEPRERYRRHHLA
jgi:hypothetical protein